MRSIQSIFLFRVLLNVVTAESKIHEDEALFLTPFINEGQLEEAFQPESAPVLLWLQGGPGLSSFFGLLVEHGPFLVDKDNVLHCRTHAWTRSHSIIYIDNPVGTGFSFTNQDDGYAKSQDDVSRDLHNALTQFFKLFPKYSEQDFYVTGESYAGKYVPALASKIHRENQRDSVDVKINLKGISVGSGWSDPEKLLNYGNYLYNIGLIDEKERAAFHDQQEATREAIRREDWLGAADIMEALMDGNSSTPSLFSQSTGFKSYFNLINPEEPADYAYFMNFVHLPYVRAGIHVGNKTFHQDRTVENFLRSDLYQSAVPWIEELLNATQGYKVLLYSGQFDIIVTHLHANQMIKAMKWKGFGEFEKQKKVVWKVGNDIAGYVKEVRNLTYIFVLKAGHIAPYDQPKWLFDMINRFTAGKPFA